MKAFDSRVICVNNRADFISVGVNNGVGPYIRFGHGTF